MAYQLNVDQIIKVLEELEQKRESITCKLFFEFFSSIQFDWNHYKQMDELLSKQLPKLKTDEVIKNYKEHVNYNRSNFIHTICAILEYHFDSVGAGGGDGGFIHLEENIFKTFLNLLCNSYNREHY
jgi:hypothetical protein